ncbi:hypothetical protein RMSM_04373 [Rhodopirellula maiorica SM1]|uniref:Uncharacterized protein n=1 Tax=Rhodopirellula maiorica SM1 TaxID=1265738 RepID=M5RXQ3_9BACT|nr:hypothetical protein RMSM_04373 [Rhodopirellula maiorica SM1]
MKSFAPAPPLASNVIVSGFGQRCEEFLRIGKREFTVAKVAETFGRASKTETLSEFRYEKMLHSVRFWR